MKNVGKIDHYLTTTKQNKTWTVCVILGLYSVTNYSAACYNVSSFQNPHNRRPIVYPWGASFGVSFVSKNSNLGKCQSHCSAVRNIMLYWTAL